ncbi:hypothetical protein BG011_005812 [Mortierella polycephala]|uniref:Uncharacterized protein n=1 Tax=Mortierella polycephala TaxID=41804 RepID=A0A9P6PUJ6_9FUNG|nr:hypothetical protein BG011_005812 [Mortierella polycephala]
MKVLSLTLGLAAVACVAAQVADPLAPADNNNNQYAWTAGQDDLAIQAEGISGLMAELGFRSQILSQMENKAEFKTDVVGCEGAKTIIKNAMETVRSTLEALKPVPVITPVIEIASNILAQLETIVNAPLDVTNGMPFNVVDITFGVAKLILTSLGSAIPFLGDTFINLAATLNSISSSIKGLVGCAGGATKTLLESTHCSGIADLYRAAVAASVKVSPALSMPAEASEDMKRLATGSLTVLDLMSKNSIATTNDALLTTRPIFASDVLDQYRIEMVRVADSDDIKAYAQASLAATVGLSNALEACLRVAADPVGAIDDLNDELEAQSRIDHDDKDEEDD